MLHQGQRRRANPRSPVLPGTHCLLLDSRAELLVTAVLEAVSEFERSEPLLDTGGAGDKGSATHGPIMDDTPDLRG